MSELLNGVLVFDVETTGLVPKGLTYENDYNHFPHIVQFAWILNGMEQDFIVKPEGYVIPQESTDIHGISHERAVAEGVPFRDVVEAFLQDAILANVIAAHNIYFDTSIIKANVLRLQDSELFKLSDPALHKDKRVDTMMKCIKFVGVTFPDSKRLKFPKLEELYFKIFAETFPAHNAIDDVRAVMRCLPELVKEGIIELKRREPKPEPLEFSDPNPVTKPIGVSNFENAIKDVSEFSDKAVVGEFHKDVADKISKGVKVKPIVPNNGLLNKSMDDF